MGAFRDLTGMRFGRLSVLRKGDRSRNQQIHWWVRCDCGTEKQVAGMFLRGKTTVSCGCYRDEVLHTAHPRKPAPMPDVVGRRFGKLTVISLYETSKARRHILYSWLCRCDCGNEKVRSTTYLLVSKSVQSCGCYAKEAVLSGIRKYNDAVRTMDPAVYSPPSPSMLKRHHISAEEYRALWNKQMGRCHGCLEHLPLKIDHDHTTGRVRGLLCHACNTSEGQLKTADRAHLFALYMERIEREGRR